MKPNTRQIAAGAALAGMTQDELAAVVGLEAAALELIMNGDVEPRPETLDRIQIALEARQVEFGPRSGVALKDEYFRRIIGKDVYIKLLDEILRTMIGRTDDVLFFMVDPAVSPPNVVDAELRLLDAGIKCRFICSEDNKVFYAPKESYRLIPRDYYTNEIQIVYGDFLAILSILPHSDSVLILNSPSVAAAERGKFDFIWNNCKKPDEESVSE